MPRHADVQQHDVRPERRGRSHGLHPVVGHADVVAQHSSSIARVCATSWLSSTTRMRSRRGSAAGGRRARRPPRRRGPAAAGPRTRCRAPALRCGASTDAAVHLHQPAHQRQADAQAALRRARARCTACVNMSNTGGSIAGRCRCRCRGRDHRAALGAAHSSSTRPPGSVYLAALFSRLANTCASRVGSPSTPERLGGRSTVNSWPVRRSAARRSRSPAPRLGQVEPLALELAACRARCGRRRAGRRPAAPSGRPAGP